MTDFGSASNKIRTYFGTAVEDVYVGLLGRVQYDNRKFVPPDDDGVWVRLTINHGETRIIAPGDQRRRRSVGVMQAQLFQRIDSGDNELYALADAISTAFTGEKVNGVSYRAASVQRMGRQFDGKLWQLNVNVPFFCDSITT